MLHNEPTSKHENLTASSIKPAPMSLYPTLDSLQSAVDLAYSQLPGVSQNTVLKLMMIYHNTLLKALEQETNYVPRKEF